MEMHILVTDDSPTIRRSVADCLRNANYKVTEAENGREALEKLASLRERNEIISLILTDVNMPEVDGIELISRLREGYYKFTPILVFTTEMDKSIVEQGKSAGASGWLRKPFEPEKLLKAVERLVWSG